MKPRIVRIEKTEIGPPWRMAYFMDVTGIRGGAKRVRIGPFSSRKDAEDFFRKYYPYWSKNHLRARHPLAHYNEPNPLSPSTETYVIAGIGIAIAAGIGLWLYTKSQANQAGTISSGPQSTTLGPGGSTTPLGSAASGTYTGGLNPDTPFVNAPGPQGPMSGPLPSPGA